MIYLQQSTYVAIGMMTVTIDTIDRYLAVSSEQPVKGNNTSGLYSKIGETRAEESLDRSETEHVRTVFTQSGSGGYAILQPLRPGQYQRLVT